MEIIDIDTKRLENYRKLFEEFLGEDFIQQADAYRTMSNEERRRNYHPFFDYWISYNLDVERNKETGIAECSFGTHFIITIILNLLDMEKLPNLQRLINSLLQKNTFYSAAFEIQTARLYSDLNEVQINNEEQNKGKIPDFTIYDKYNNTKKINIECKSLEDYDIQNHCACEILTEQVQNFCIENNKSYSIWVKTGENFYQSDINQVVKNIIDLIKLDSIGKYYITNYNVEVEINKIDNNCSEIHIGNSEQHISLEMLPNNFFNLTFMGTESKPNINFDKQIYNEINKARKQLIKNELNLLHIQLPCNNNLNYEQYIHSNYSKIKIWLERSTKRINAIVISNSIYQTANMQFFVIPNCKTRKNIDFDFKFPTVYTDINNIPELPYNNPKIELNNIFFTPLIDWDKYPLGSFIFSLSSSTAKTQFKIWKSYDGTITIDIIIDGRLRFFKYNKNPFILGQRNKIDLTIQGEKVDFYVNDRKVYDTKLLSTLKVIKGAKA